MTEYPKVIVVDGLSITVQSDDEEARWRAKPEAPTEDAPVESDDALDTLALDGAALNDGHVPEPEDEASAEPEKKSRKKK